MAAIVIDKNDKALQYKMAVEGLLKSAGYKLFRESFDEMVAYSKAQSQIQASKGHVNVDGLCLLNYNLGYDAGLLMVSNIFKNFEDELIGSDVKGKK